VHVKGTAFLKTPRACTEVERQEFARLVREGFDGSDETLPERIRDSKSLTFYYAEDGTLAAVAALKAPPDGYRDRIFENAGSSATFMEFRYELGWVFVVPNHRGFGIATDLCRMLLAGGPASPVFATTRPDNLPMIRILLSVGFSQAGHPFSLGVKDLVLFLQSQPGTGRP